MPIWRRNHQQSSDKKWMQRAIELAKRGSGYAHPNPIVGAVIVAGNKLIGEGWHAYYGADHAEVMAFKSATDSARSATMYVTLEPCFHKGKTPPCVDAVIDAGINRVVIATLDPNPLTQGKSIEKLKLAGIQVEVGLLEQEAFDLNPYFFKRMKTGMPWVTVKMACSIDGKIGPNKNTQFWLTGEQARHDVHMYRAMSDAILTTANTVVADNPSLNVRLPKSDEITKRFTEYSLPEPVVVVAGDLSKLTKNYDIFKRQKLAWLPTRPVEADALKRIRTRSIKTSTAVVRTRGIDALPAEKKADFWCDDYAINHQIDWPSALRWIAKTTNSNRLMTECGPGLAGFILQQNLADELIIYTAPKVIGSEGVDVFSGDILRFANNNSRSKPDPNNWQLKAVTAVGQDIKSIYHFRTN